MPFDIEYETFPRELWLQIAELHIPPPYDLECNKLSIPRFHKRCEQDKSNAYVVTPRCRKVLTSQVRKKQESLANLSRTCRALHSLLTPLLYQSIILMENCGKDRCDSLVLLCRTLCERPQLGSHVKHIACLVNLREDRLWPEESPLMHGHQLDLQKSWELYHMPSELHSAMSRHYPHRIGEWSLGLILLASSNIESLVLQLPRRILRTLENTYFLSRDTGLGSEPQYDTLHDILEEAMRNDPTVLGSLRVLKLQTDMDGGPWVDLEGSQAALRRDQSLIDRVEVQWNACPALFGAPNLSEFHVLGHSLRGMTIPRQIKVLYISGYYRNSTARLFLLHASGVITAPALLEKLTLHPFPQYYGAMTLHADRQAAIDSLETSELAWSLGMYEYFIWLSRHTLRSLDLQTMGRWSALSGCWRYDHARRLHGIRCLPEMHRLAYLTIELGALLGTPERCGAAELGAVLPPNLEGLVLVERWRPTCQHRSCQADCPVGRGALTYARSFLTMLNGLARRQPAALPRLAALTLVCNRAWRMGSLASARRSAQGVEAAVLRPVLRGPEWNGRDVYHRMECDSFDHEDFANAARIFARNGVAFDIGLLERGRYYAIKPSRSWNNEEIIAAI